jgi:hypothetical protein
VISVSAVREIQAGYVHACLHQAFNDARGGASRADSANNFGVAEGHVVDESCSLREGPKVLISES